MMAVAADDDDQRRRAAWASGPAMIKTTMICHSHHGVNQSALADY